MGNSNIEWTDKTWNPIRGCTRVSEGCRNCYAEPVAYRFSGPGQAYEGLVRIGADGNRRREWNGQVKFVEDHLLDPLKWKAPARIFVNSMSDLFHENVKDEWIDRIFAVMALCPQHTFQVLTKRPQRMLEYLTSKYLLVRWGFRASEIIGRSAEDRAPVFPLFNVHLGVSCENQATADERIPPLLKTPAAVRFISAEPLLGPIDLEKIPTGKGNGEVYDPIIWMNPLRRASVFAPHLHWVIVGGESGPGARPCNTTWVREIVLECHNSGVACFVKQLGGHVIQNGERRTKADKKGGDMDEWPHDIRVREFPQESVIR